jgi:hypothetical protein
MLFFRKKNKVGELPYSKTHYKPTVNITVRLATVMR